MTTVREYRIFVATTGDNNDMRTVIDETMREMEQTTRGKYYRTIHWNRDVTMLFGQPGQLSILQEFAPKEWDIFVGLLWHRFGSPTGMNDPATGAPYPSGTLQEFLAAMKEIPRGLPVLFYRRDTPIKPSLVDSEQLKLIQEFFRDVSSGTYGGYAFSFDTSEQLKTMLRRDISFAVNRLEKSGT